MKYLGIALLVMIGLFFIGLGLRACSMANSGADLIQKTYDPQEMQKKYEWFKDAAAQCDAKIANLRDYEFRFNTFKEDYGKDSVNRSKWTREDRETYSQWQSEYLGVKQSYNDLAAQYNAQMAKWNYRFTNVGDLPAGTTNPLPREFKPYQ
jgi:hypothetical protein